MARLYRFQQDKGGIGVAFSDHPIEKEDHAFLLSGEDDVYALLQTALAEGKLPKTLVKERLTAERVSLEQLHIEKRFLLPIEHHDPARCIVTGTGLTHSGSADIRNDMNSHDTNLSDSMRLYLKGKEGGKPTAETIGTQPEWFYKGTGHCLLPHGAPILTPNYSLTAGEEPEVGGVYLIDDKGAPHRAGYVLGNDFSDHQLEGQNYLFVAVSKLRPCPLAPALFLGELPGSVEITTHIKRNEQTLWKKTFHTGEDHMNHSIANLEHHHFKHETIFEPNTIHIHLFGCPLFSYGDDISLEDGDHLTITAPAFGQPLKNTIQWEKDQPKRFTIKEIGA